MKITERPDTYQERRKHLAGLSDEELFQRFWKLTEQIVDPMINLAQDHTSPSIERSVLLRMGFNSLEATEIVKRVNEAGLLAKGAGGIVYRMAQKLNIPYQEAGKRIIDGAEIVF